MSIPQHSPTQETAEGRVDLYWREIITQKGADKTLLYSNLAKLIKAALLLPHGNADVERSFSVVNDMVTVSRTNVTANIINGLLLTKDALKFYDPQNMLPSSVPLPRTLLNSCRMAYAAYQSGLQEEKKEKQKAEAEKAIEEEKAKKLKKTLEAQQAESKARKEQLEGSAKLASAIKAKDFKQASAAQMMLEQGQKRLRDASSQLEKVTRQKFYVISKSTVAEQTHSDSSSSTAKKRKCT